MHTYVVPAFVFIRPLLGQFDDRADMLTTIGVREKLFSMLFDGRPTSDTDVNRRFFLFDNIRHDRYPSIKLSLWLGRYSPSQAYKLPKSYAVDIVRDVYEAYPTTSDILLGVTYLAKGREAGVFTQGAFGSYVSKTYCDVGIHGIR